MRSSLVIGVVVCAAGLIGCGDATTSDNGGTGNTPGTGGDNRGPGDELTPGEYSCVTVVPGAEGGCKIISSWEFFVPDPGNSSLQFNGWVQLGVSSHQGDPLQLEEGDVVTELDRHGLDVEIAFDVPDEYCAANVGPGQAGAPGCDGQNKSYRCDASGPRNSPGTGGTFTMTLVEWNYDTGRFHITLEATCAPDMDGTGDPVSGSMDLVIQR
jgi:hypothetical protein